MRSSTRLAVLALLAVMVALYQFTDRIVAYTSDAYVQSDIVEVAPQVAGPVAAVHVVDNQHVAAGDELLTIDPTNYRLAVDLQARVVAAAVLAVASKKDSETAARAKLDDAKAKLDLEQANFGRISPLRRSGDLPQASLDAATALLAGAKDAVADAQAMLGAASSDLSDQQAAVDTERARLALVQNDLDHTVIRAPVAGPVNALRLRVGDFARVGVPLLGIVDDAAWRVVANYREFVAAAMAPGTDVLVWLDAHPWHLRRGTVRGVGRGIARSPAPDSLLPYVEPTTDWIRLPRRFPVTITLDDLPENIRLFMGADARVIWVR